MSTRVFLGFDLYPLLAVLDGQDGNQKAEEIGGSAKLHCSFASVAS